MVGQKRSNVAEESRSTFIHPVTQRANKAGVHFITIILLQQSYLFLLLPKLTCYISWSDVAQSCSPPLYFLSHGNAGIHTRWLSLQQWSVCMSWIVEECLQHKGNATQKPKLAFKQMIKVFCQFGESFYSELSYFHIGWLHEF